jgi:hypothetical protein
LLASQAAKLSVNACEERIGSRTDGRRAKQCHGDDKRTEEALMRRAIISEGELARLAEKQHRHQRPAIDLLGWW